MSNEQLPADVRATRKSCWNSNIVKACSTPKLAHSHPVLQGIGLYTHVADPKAANMNPCFDYIDNTDREVALLPLGGPRRIHPAQVREPPGEELAALYRELRDAVQAEEKIWSDQRAAASERGGALKDAYSLTLDTLKKKYSESDARPAAPAVLQHYDRDRDPRRRLEMVDAANPGASKKRKVSFAPDPAPRRKSTGNIFIPNKRPDAERRGSGSNNVYSRR